MWVLCINVAKYLGMYLIFVVSCRASFDSLAVPSKRKALTEGEDTEEDVEEPKVSIRNLHGLKKHPPYHMIINLINIALF